MNMSRVAQCRCWWTTTIPPPNLGWPFAIPYLEHPQETSFRPAGARSRCARRRYRRYLLRSRGCRRQAASAAPSERPLHPLPGHGQLRRRPASRGRREQHAANGGSNDMSYNPAFCHTRCRCRSLCTIHPPGRVLMAASYSLAFASSVPDSPPCPKALCAVLRTPLPGLCDVAVPLRPLLALRVAVELGLLGSDAPMLSAVIAFIG